MPCGGCGGGKRVRSTRTPQISRTNVGYQATVKSLKEKEKVKKAEVPVLKQIRNYKSGSFSTKSNKCWKCGALLYKKKRMSKTLFLFKCSACENEIFINSNGEVMEK